MSPYAYLPMLTHLVCHHMLTYQFNHLHYFRGGIEAGSKEVDASIERLFHYAAYADKFGGVVQETPFYGLTVSINEPTGVIGMVCPNEVPLLGLVSLVAPAVVRGNCVVAVPSEKVCFYLPLHLNEFC